MNFNTCPKQGLEMEDVVPHRVGFLEYFCPKQGQDFKPSAVPLYPNMGQVPPPPPPRANSMLSGYDNRSSEGLATQAACFPIVHHAIFSKEFFFHPS